jgi:hypothetical protein
MKVMYICRCRVAMSHNAIAEILGRWVPWCMVVVLASLDLGRSWNMHHMQSKYIIL